MPVTEFELCAGRHQGGVIIRSRRHSLAALVSVLVLLAGCSSAATQSPSGQSGSPTSPSTAPATPPASAGASVAALPPDGGWPWTGTLKDGSTFTLASRIADKIKAHQPINYYLSLGTTTTDIFSAQMLAGYALTLPDAQKIYPLNPKVVAPATAYDSNAQIAQVEALFNSNQLDCLSYAVSGADQFTNETAKLQAAGVPVFTNGAPTNGNEIQQFTQIPEKEGAQTAQVVLDWAKKNNITLKFFTMTSGAPASTWAQGRFISFRNAIMAAIPDAVFINDETNAMNVTFEPSKAYDAYKAFIIGHPNVQVIMNADQTSGSADKAIVDTGNKGKMWTVGWNPSFDQLDAIDAGTQIAVMDQKWADQAGFGAMACATFFADGKILPNTQVLIGVTKDNTDKSRAWLTKLLGAQ